MDGLARSRRLVSLLVVREISLSIDRSKFPLFLWDPEIVTEVPEDSHEDRSGDDFVGANTRWIRDQEEGYCSYNESGTV